jgi:hypothetical protein
LEVVGEAVVLLLEAVAGLVLTGQIHHLLLLILGLLLLLEREELLTQMEVLRFFHQLMKKVEDTVVTIPLRMEPLMALLPVVVVVELVAKSPQGGLEGLTETLEEVLIIPLAQEPLEVGVEQEEQEAMQVPQ